ncbi:MAG: glycine cleavage system aminomethyltransferase GcvT [Candidatus Paracaedibacteraceae bacterium]|nr:glycine cleavage system aminomethyltransferase GcvT [Candidatus Paracaedibacteraceae bacterium]
MITAPTLSSIPLDQLHRDLGARMVPFAGYDMPVQYPTGIIQEHRHVRQAAGLFDVSHMGAIFVPNNPAIELEKIFPTDLQELEIGHIKYSLLLNNQGGIEDDLLISRLEDGFLLVVNAGRKHHNLDFLRNALPSVDFVPLFDKAMVAFQGPKARTILSTLCTEASSMAFMTTKKTTILDYNVILSCSGYTGEDGFEFICGSDHAFHIVKTLLDHEDVKPIGLGARDSLRLEAGLCLYGHELDSKTSPIEASLAWAIGKRRRLEGKFAGAPRVLTELKDTPQRKRIGLIPESRSIPREGCSIHDAAGNPVGVVTSGGQSPVLGHPIAMGYITNNTSTKGLTVNIRDTHYPVKIAKLPFVPTQYKK